MHCRSLAASRRRGSTPPGPARAQLHRSALVADASGVTLISVAHGCFLENLVKNYTLLDIISCTTLVGASASRVAHGGGLLGTRVHTSQVQPPCTTNTAPTSDSHHRLVTHGRDGYTQRGFGHTVPYATRPSQRATAAERH
jgi:hypothetical protein